MEILNTNWNDERMGRLKTLHQDGLSFSLIANEIGTSRNAVIGKAHRMQLPRRVETQIIKKPRSNARPPPKRERIHKAAAVIEPAAVIESEPEPRDHACTIYDLKDNSCRYPLWDTNTPHSDRRYCGHPSASLHEGVPYCARHCAKTLTQRP